MARSFPHPVSFHSLGGGKLRLPGRLQGVAHGPIQACVRACVAACRPACGSPEPRADLRADLREPHADLRAALRGPDSATPTPLLPLRFGSLADRELRRAERNLGEYWSDDLKFSYCASDGLESEATAPCRAHDHMAVGSRWVLLVDRAHADRLASRAAVKLGGCAWVWWRDQGGGDNRLRKASLALSRPLQPTRPQGASSSGSASEELPKGLHWVGCRREHNREGARSKSKVVLAMPPTGDGIEALPVGNPGAGEGPLRCAPLESRWGALRAGRGAP